MVFLFIYYAKGITELQQLHNAAHTEESYQCWNAQPLGLSSQY